MHGVIYHLERIKHILLHAPICIYLVVLVLSMSIAGGWLKRTSRHAYHSVRKKARTVPVTVLPPTWLYGARFWTPQFIAGTTDADNKTAAYGDLFTISNVYPSHDVRLLLIWWSFFFRCTVLLERVRG